MAKVAFLLASDFEDSEMRNPYEAIKKAGHEVTIVGNKEDNLCIGKHNTVSYYSEMSSAEALEHEFDAVVIPGGGAPEVLRVNEDTLNFVKDLNMKSKIIAGICHGPQVMISADVIRDKTLTCFKGIRDDVINGGAEYVDEEVVVSKNIITARTPKDEPAFIREILSQISGL
ncbi:type 1 glutamine amidotransferase domain-containing protein [Oceanobacillus saliphilus]|uniref:type 1 glutamine amidotransferase domain-containing protein n=1 Tax=Oceanobacillus saliphilus TaxID=2925834 RepID=UPI00201E28D7|nr:type 1 glutamine amidotransferase domain-containing protein [Oceanobacillus saliphilus]